MNAATSNPHSISLLPEKEKQVILGIGFEIQSDSIGSGNNGLPDEPSGVPHDLIPEERNRLADEMLKGFRYCRLAGGLYWRGLDAEEKHLQPRWPEQMEELRDLLDRAQVEGLSFEYWSPAPYWKSNRAYPGGTLRCFGPEFENDADYQGDVDRFLKEFSEAVVDDIRTLRQAGIATKMFGLQNEPKTSHSCYSTCMYNGENFVKAYAVVAHAVRKHDPSILLFADTEGHFPSKIATEMDNPAVAKLVDAYVIHIIGQPACEVADRHAEIRERLPLRPWFQNEYEYITGIATPERCLNTVEHIINSFQIGENPTWFWLHALKPITNAEASGYSLGYWKSREESGCEDIRRRQKCRWTEGPAFTFIPGELEDAELVNVTRREGDRAPGPEFSMVFSVPAEIYLVVDAKSQIELNPDEGYSRTDWVSTYADGRQDVIYRKITPGNETIHFPANTHQQNGRFGPPHALFVKLTGEAAVGQGLQVGINSPTQIYSQAVEVDRMKSRLQPGQWIYNDFNWNAVGSFVKRMPWDSVCINIKDSHDSPTSRVLAFKRPDNKYTVVLSNSHCREHHSLEVATGLLDGTWKGFRYTPFERGEQSLGVPVGRQTRPTLRMNLPPLSWEFWEQQ